MAKKITGVVTSDVNDKTILVSVTRRETHPIYGKKFLTSVKYQAHDEKNQAKKGDTVTIAECRPLSRHKSWTLVEIVERGHEAVELKKEQIEEEADARAAKKAEKSDAETKPEDSK